jgi:hypothetical protein
LAAIALFLVGCGDAHDTSSPDPPSVTPTGTYGLYLETVTEAIPQTYQVVDGETLYAAAGGTTLQIPAANAAFQINDDGSRTPVDVLVQVSYAGGNYGNGNVITIDAAVATTMTATIEGTTLTINIAAIPSPHFSGEIALQHGTRLTVFEHTNTHNLESSASLNIIQWRLTGWAAVTGTVVGTYMDGRNAANQVTTGSDATHVTVSSGPSDGYYASCQITVGTDTRSFNFWVTNGFLLPSSGTDLMINGIWVQTQSNPSNGDAMLHVTLPAGSTCTWIVLNVVGGEPKSNMTRGFPVDDFQVLDSNGNPTATIKVATVQIGDWRGPGQTYTVTASAGQPVDPGDPNSPDISTVPIPVTTQ